MNPRFGGGSCKLAEVVEEANRLANTLLVELPLLFELLGLLIVEAKFRGACASSSIGLAIGFSGNSGLWMGKTEEPTAATEDRADGGIGGGDATFRRLGSSSATAEGSTFALSSAKASQKALCVIKLSLLENRVPQSHLYSRVPQTFEWAFQSD